MHNFSILNNKKIYKRKDNKKIIKIKIKIVLRIARENKYRRLMLKILRCKAFNNYNYNVFLF